MAPRNFSDLGPLVQLQLAYNRKRAIYSSRAKFKAMRQRFFPADAFMRRAAPNGHARTRVPVTYFHAAMG